MRSLERVREPNELWPAWTVDLPPAAFDDVTPDCRALAAFITRERIASMIAGEILCMEIALSKISSPIERMFWAAFHARTALAGDVFKSDTVTFSDGCPSDIYHLETQKQFGRFRVDFYITYTVYGSPWVPDDGLSTSVCVECDGHDYHERTKEQAAKDRARDRYFTLKGIPFMRFTGSEIWKDAFGCVEQVREFLHAPELKLREEWNAANAKGGV